MAQGPADAIKLLAKVLVIDAPPERARDVLVKICLHVEWYSNKNDAVEAAEKWEKAFLKKLRVEIDYWDRMGKTFHCTINTSSPDMIQGVAFIEQGDSDGLKAEKRSLVRCSHYCSSFKSLTPAQFESLCAGILQLLGVTDVKLTPQSRDEGIDFYGKLSLEIFMRGQKTFAGIERQLAVWMIGQAKHFQDDLVSTLEIRELVGSVFFARTRTYSTKPDTRYADLSLRACDPVFYLFITTNFFSNDSLALLEKSGIIGMDCDMVASFLSQRDIGIVNDAFSQSAFIDWVNTKRPVAD